MKSNIHSCAANLIVAFVFCFTSACAQKTNQVPKEIPEFTFYTVDKDAPFTRNNLASNGKNIVILFFDPGCSHCQQEVLALGKNYNSIKNINLYMVAMQEKNLINAFMSMYGGQLRNKKNVTLLHDKNYEFIGRFKPTQYPATFVYGGDKKLKKYWDGEKKTEEIIKALNL
ncbi:peroxiredoxin family protein [Olivibacter jilunii]|uniref:peroxiredoxin family protein n=1 Tax=Olivibacter jilunii TaxID=985016 RepID=UPI003F16AC69